MKTYTVLYAEDVPHYGTREFEVADDDLAIARAIDITPDAMSLFTQEPDHKNPNCRRIVHIEGPNGVIAEGIYLDPPEPTSPLVLASLRSLIEKADGLISAIEGVTDQFETEVSQLCEATSAAEKALAQRESA